MLAAIAEGYFREEKLDVDYSLFISSRPTFIQVDAREIEIMISQPRYELNVSADGLAPRAELSLEGFATCFNCATSFGASRFRRTSACSRRPRAGCAI